MSAQEHRQQEEGRVAENTRRDKQLHDYKVLEQEQRAEDRKADARMREEKHRQEMDQLKMHHKATILQNVHDAAAAELKQWNANPAHMDQPHPWETKPELRRAWITAEYQQRLKDLGIEEAPRGSKPPQAPALPRLEENPGTDFGTGKGLLAKKDEQYRNYLDPFLPVEELGRVRPLLENQMVPLQQQQQKAAKALADSLGPPSRTKALAQQQDRARRKIESLDQLLSTIMAAQREKRTLTIGERKHYEHFLDQFKNAHEGQTDAKTLLAELALKNKRL
jgi:hypothetical protein